MAKAREKPLRKRCVPFLGDMLTARFTQHGEVAMIVYSSGLALDIQTLLVFATGVAVVIGLVLLFAWRKDKTRALLWWSVAYLIGGASVALWCLEKHGLDFIPSSLASAMLLFACGTMWSAARLFHRRPVAWPWLCAGSVIWIAAGLIPGVNAIYGQRVALSAIIIAVYTSLTAFEFWRERRKSRFSRALACVVPPLHGTVLLLPVAFAGFMPQAPSASSLMSGWIAVFAIDALLYAVAAGFVVLTMANDQLLAMHKTAASTDLLTGLFNRRAFNERAEDLIKRRARKDMAVTVVLFDIDWFKQVNDRLGHAIGDETLKVFARTVSANLRLSDVVARLGGDEFAAIFAETLEDTAVAAERVRAAFELAAENVLGHRTGASTSIGLASGLPGTPLSLLLGQADKALYRAKAAGRNCVEADGIGMVTPGRQSANASPIGGAVPATAVGAPAAARIAEPCEAALAFAA
jgi:diguanylate cyclase (GGDEF)-like protein